MSQHEKINYIELPAEDFHAVRHFFNQVFGWQFQDYGPDYMAFSQAGLEGGFYRSEHQAVTEQGSALVVFYSQDLEATQSKIESAKGRIIKPIFYFPGGRRFHFADPHGNEYAVWSDLDGGQPIKSVQ